MKPESMLQPAITRLLRMLRLMAIVAIAGSCAESSTEASLEIGSFTADPAHLAGPGTSTLSWTVSGADSIAILQEGSPIELEDPTAATGTVEVRVEETTSFELVASARGGEQKSRSLTIQVAAESEAPSITLLEAPEWVTADELGGADATIQWEVEGATTLTLELDPGESFAIEEGSIAMGELEVRIVADTVVTLVAENESGRSSAEVSIGLLSTPTITVFKSDRSRVGPGDSISLLWETEGADSVELWMNGERLQEVDEASVDGTLEVVILFDATFELRALNRLEASASETLEVVIGQPVFISWRIEEDSIWLGDIGVFSWELEGAETLVLEIDGSGELLFDSEVSDGVGTFHWEPEVEGEYLVRATATNSAGPTVEELEVFIASGPFIRTLEASSSVVDVGESVTIAWEVRADPAGETFVLSLEDDEGTSYPLTEGASSQQIPITKPGELRLTLTASSEHPRSKPAQSSVLLYRFELPLVTLDATPSFFDDSIDAEVTLSWTAQHAVGVELFELIDGERNQIYEADAEELAAGSLPVVPHTSRVYEIVAINGTGTTAKAEATVTVAPTEILEFSVSPNSVLQGEAVEMSWRTRSGEVSFIPFADKVYLREETRQPYVDIQFMGADRIENTGSVLWRRETIRFPAGFVFPFDGVERTAVTVFDNGILSFDEVANVPPRHGRASFPSSTDWSFVHLAPFWVEDVHWDPTFTPLRGPLYLFRGGEGEEPRHLIIQWKELSEGLGAEGCNELNCSLINQPPRGSSLNFQVVLWEDGTFEYRYDELDPGPQRAHLDMSDRATIGFQLPSNRDQATYAFAPSTPRNGKFDRRSLRFSPMPSFETSGTFVWHPYSEQADLEVGLTVSRGEEEDSASNSIAIERLPAYRLRPAAPAPAVVGETVTLFWQTADTSSLRIVDQDGVDRCVAQTPAEVEEGHCTLSEESEGVFGFRVLMGTNSGATIEREIPLVFYQDFGISKFEVDRATVDQGEGITLSWETYFDGGAQAGARLELLADGVAILDDIAAVAAGSHTIPALSKSQTFTLRLHNALGVSQEATIPVTVWSVEMEISAPVAQARAGEEVVIDVDVTPLGGGNAPLVYGPFPMTETSATFLDISALPLATEVVVGVSQLKDESIQVQFPAGFSFPYFGVEYDRAVVSLYGFLSFDSDVPPNVENIRLPAPGGGAEKIHMAPFWDDASSRHPASISYGLVDDDTFIIQWSHVSFRFGFGTVLPDYPDLNYQVVLHRSGAFEYRYGLMAPQHESKTTPYCFPETCVNEANGSSATIGYQDPSASTGYSLHFGGTHNGPTNRPFPGGLAHRSFRYEPKVGSFSLPIIASETANYSFCVNSGGAPACKGIGVEVDFELESFRTTPNSVVSGASTTLQWSSRGATKLVIREGSEIVYTTEDLSEIDQGELSLTPTRDSLYELELSGGYRSRTAKALVLVEQARMTTSIAPAGSQEGGVILSWEFEAAAGDLQPVIVQPMEEDPSLLFSQYDLSLDPEATVVISGGVSERVGTLDAAAGFPFNYLGVEYEQLRISSEGYLSFTASHNSAIAANQPIPNVATNLRNVHLAPFWDDLHTRTWGRVYSKHVGDGTYVVQWSNISLAAGSTDRNEYNLNFQVVLRRDGSFDFRYGLMLEPAEPGPANACFPTSCHNEANGSAATIGFQDPSGRAGQLLHFGGTTPGEGQRPVTGGLSNRSWRFTPVAGDGSVELHPTETTAYRVCALLGEDVICGISEVEVSWGIHSFEASADSFRPGEAITLGWTVEDLDSLTLTANGDVLATWESGTIPQTGTEVHSPTTETLYVLEGTSRGRVVRAEQRVALRTFTLDVQAPLLTYAPGEGMPVSWNATALEPGELHLAAPLGEIPAGPGAAGAFLDVRGLEGATKLVTNSINGYADTSLPFSFPYFGEGQTSARITAKGYLSFGTPTTTAEGNTSLPTLDSETSQVHLAVFWDVLVMRNVDEIWTYQPDSESFVIQWSNFNRVEGSTAALNYDLNFQIVLFSDGAFEYRYGRMDPLPAGVSHEACLTPRCEREANGAAATIGYQSVDRSLASTLHQGAIPELTTVTIPFLGTITTRTDVGGREEMAGGLAHRSFRYSPALQGVAEIAAGRGGPVEVCGSLAGYIHCESVAVRPLAEPGDLIITEIAARSTAGVSGQWFEVRNLSLDTLDLEGFVISTEQGSHTIGGSLQVGPAEFLTLAATAGVGFTPDYVYGEGVPLNPDVDELSIHVGQSRIASVRWRDDWTHPLDGSLELDSRFHVVKRTSNDSFGKWCEAGGSPGARGLSCGSEAYLVDMSPASTSFRDISSIGTRVFDLERIDVMHPIVLGSPMPFFGESLTRVWASSNGWISFATNQPTQNPAIAVPGALPRNASHALNGPLLSAFWGSLSCDRGSFDCRFFRYHDIEAGVEYLQWSNYRMRGFSGSVTFQVQLHESGDVVVAFGDVWSDDARGTKGWNAYNGFGPWIGLEDEDRSSYITANQGAILELPHRSIRFVPR